MSRAGELEAELVDRGFRLDPNFQPRGYLRHALGSVQSNARVTLANAPGWTALGDATSAYTLIRAFSA